MPLRHQNLDRGWYVTESSVLTAYLKESREGNFENLRVTFVFHLIWFDANADSSVYNSSRLKSYLGVWFLLPPRIFLWTMSGVIAAL